MKGPATRKEELAQSAKPDWCLADGRWKNSGMGAIERRWIILPLPRGEYVFSASAVRVAQSASLSVSVQNVVGRDDVAERGSVSRSTLTATDALELSKRWAAGKAPAGHRPALLWLRLRRAGLYRRFG